jgi:hypothetical protein
MLLYRKDFNFRTDLILIIEYKTDNKKVIKVIRTLSFFNKNNQI